MESSRESKKKQKSAHGHITINPIKIIDKKSQVVSIDWDRVEIRSRRSSRSTDLNIDSLATFDDNISPSDTIYSVFGDHECGEPLRSQHIKLDFTPTEEDTDEIQEKVFNFWKMIYSHPELQPMMAVPNQYKESTEKNTLSEAQAVSISAKPQKKTAISLICQETGLANGAFQTSGHCVKCMDPTMDSDYIPQTSSAKALKSFKKQKCTCPKPCKLHSRKSRSKAKQTSKQQADSDIAAMCQEMEEWEEKHPKCRPFCKNRRHQFGGKTFKTSAELLIERKRQPDCVRRFPRRVYPNSPCPLLKRYPFRVTEVPKYVDRKPNVVRICQAPLDVDVITPYIRGALLAIRTGAWDDVDACCPFCTCCKCCCCGTRIYPIADPDREAKIKDDMKAFDERVKTECMVFKVVYNRKEL